MAISKLNTTFSTKQKLTSSGMNEITGKVDELVDASNTATSNVADLASKIGETRGDDITLVEYGSTLFTSNSNAQGTGTNPGNSTCFQRSSEGVVKVRFCVASYSVHVVFCAFDKDKNIIDSYTIQGAKKVTDSIEVTLGDDVSYYSVFTLTSKKSESSLSEYKKNEIKSNQQLTNEIKTSQSDILSCKSSMIDNTISYGNSLFSVGVKGDGSTDTNAVAIVKRSALGLKKIEFAVSTYRTPNHVFFCAWDKDGNELQEYHMSNVGKSVNSPVNVTIEGSDICTFSVCGYPIANGGTINGYYYKETANSLQIISKKADINDVNKTYHNVLWLGTSIPEGTPYAQGACEKLGWKCFNLALGSSGICLNSGVLGNDRDGKDLSESTDEKIERYKDHIGSGTAGSGTITQSRYNSMMDWGYDKRIIPYIDGTIASCDMVVFDHGYNDRDQISLEISGFETANKSMTQSYGDIDRSTYIGAFVYLAKKIWSVNPKIRIAICSYLENEDTSRKGKTICDYQKKIADFWHFPFLNMCDLNGFSRHLNPGTAGYLKNFNDTYGTSYTVENNYAEPNSSDPSEQLISTFQMYCPDRVHPHTDLTGASKDILTNNILKLLSNM